MLTRAVRSQLFIRCRKNSPILVEELYARVWFRLIAISRNYPIRDLESWNGRETGQWWSEWRFPEHPQGRTTIPAIDPARFGSMGIHRRWNWIQLWKYFVFRFHLRATEKLKGLRIFRLSKFNLWKKSWKKNLSKPRKRLRCKRFQNLKEDYRIWEGGKWLNASIMVHKPYFSEWNTLETTKYCFWVQKSSRDKIKHRFW